MSADLPVVDKSLLPVRAAFRLEPIIAPTSQRQKLSDYVVGLATESLIPVDVLVRDLVMWPQPSATQIVGKRLPFACGQRLELVNSTGITARYWSDAVNHLVGRDDMAALTLLGFAPVLNDPAGLVARQRRWCPACLQADLEHGASVYERLLWSIRLVTRCPLHDLDLLSLCAECKYFHKRQLTRRAVSGMCGRCHAWLGVASLREASQSRALDPQARWEQWTAQQVSSLLELTGQQMQTLSKANVRAMLDAGIDALSDGNAKQFAKLCGKATSSLSEWRKGANFPSMSTLLVLSWNCGIPLTAWLTGDRDAWQSAQPSMGSTPLSTGGIRRTRAARSWVAIGRHLRACASSPDFTKSWAATADGVQVDPSELRRRFPQNAAAIGEKARRARSTDAKERRMQRRKRIETVLRQVLKDCGENDGVPTRRFLDAALREGGVTVRYSEYPFVKAIANGRV